MDSVVNNLMSSWDSVVGETEKKRNSFFNLSLSDLETSSHNDQKSLTSMKSGNTVESSSGVSRPTADTQGADFPASSNANAGSIFSSSQLTDKLVERIISMALPPSSESQFTQGVITDRLEMQKTRPSLSVPIMSRNFILMNSRLSLPFEIIDEIIKIASWSKPYYTLSILVILTNLILNPVLAVLSPVLYLLFGIMCPAYFKHHPLETSENFPHNNPVPARGLPLTEVTTPKPVPELSREFVLNLTDLQNHLLIYVAVFDFFNWLIIQFCYFQDEAISSYLFLVLLSFALATGLILPVLVKYLPLLPITQLVLVVALWALAISFHPLVRDQILTVFYSEETRLKTLTLTNKIELYLRKQLEFVEEQEIREVEIFEIQYLDPETSNWNFVCYSTDFFSLNSTTKKLNLPIAGTQSLQMVRPPVDWDFIPNFHSSSGQQNDNWKLDLNPSVWVANNLVLDVIEIDQDEKWCYDKKLPNSNSVQIRRRRWCRDVIRSFQVDEIKALFEMEEEKKKMASSGGVAGSDSGHEQNYEKKKYQLSVNSALYGSAHDDKKRNSKFLLDAQYNSHMRKKSGGMGW